MVAKNREGSLSSFPTSFTAYLFSCLMIQLFMETGFLDRLANQLKVNKSATCRRAIQRILVRVKEHSESGQYKSTTDAENEFRRLVDSDLACK